MKPTSIHSHSFLVLSLSLSICQSVCLCAFVTHTYTYTYSFAGLLSLSLNLFHSLFLSHLLVFPSPPHLHTMRLPVWVEMGSRGITPRGQIPQLMNMHAVLTRRQSTHTAGDFGFLSGDGYECNQTRDPTIPCDGADGLDARGGWWRRWRAALHTSYREG